MIDAVVLMCVEKNLCAPCQSVAVCPALYEIDFVNFQYIHVWIFESFISKAKVLTK